MPTGYIGSFNRMEAERLKKESFRSFVQNSQKKSGKAKKKSKK